MKIEKFKYNNSTLISNNLKIVEVMLDNTTVSIIREVTSAIGDILHTTIYYIPVSVLCADGNVYPDIDKLLINQDGDLFKLGSSCNCMDKVGIGYDFEITEVDTFLTNCALIDPCK